MDPSHLFVQILVATLCAGIANILIPRQIPGKFLGLIAIGLVGVWFGEVAITILRLEFRVDYEFLHWNFRGVPLISSFFGSVLILYVVTSLAQWARYSR